MKRLPSIDDAKYYAGLFRAPVEIIWNELKNYDEMTYEEMFKNLNKALRVFINH